MSLMRLPTEIDLMLLRMLDYASLMNLTATNRYYLFLRTNDLVRQALLQFEEVCMKEWKSVNFQLPYRFAGSRFGVPETMMPWITRLDDLVLPCYGCLRLLTERTNFIQKEKLWTKNLKGKRAAERRCKDCHHPLRRSHAAMARKLRQRKRDSTGRKEAKKPASG